MPREGKLRHPAALYYHRVLDVVDLGSGENAPKIAVPRRIHCGYLNKKGRSFFIRPAKREAYRLSVTHPLLLELVQSGGEEFAARFAVKTVYYEEREGKLTALYRDRRAGTKEGSLIYRAKRTCYLFAEEDKQAEQIRIPDHIVAMHERIGVRPPEEEHRAIPVFYMRHSEDGEERIYYNQKRFLSIGFRYRTDAGLPPAHKEKTERVDYVTGMFGDREHGTRLFFEDCSLVGEENFAPAVSKRLYRPQPAYYPTYVADGKNYNDPDFRLRGYKQYWLKDPKGEDGVLPEESGKRPVKCFAPLAEGSRFRGVIRFRNLHADELGALLWALKLERDCYQSMGRGRPEGYGRMEVAVDRLVTYDVRAGYADLLPVRKEETGDVDGYIQTYIRCAESRLPGDIPLRERTELRDFFYIRSRICSGEWVENMNREQCRDVQLPLPSIRQIREGEAGHADAISNDTGK